MKKLSDINESIWSDLQDRSSGEVARKEDFLKDTYDYLCSKYQVVYANMDEIEYKNDHVHLPVYITIGVFASIDIGMDKIAFSSIDPDRYKNMKRVISKIESDINQLFDKIKETYSPEISTLDGLEHWITFKVFPKDGKMTKEFCSEFIDFILDNRPNENEYILNILEKK